MNCCSFQLHLYHTKTNDLHNYIFCNRMLYGFYVYDSSRFFALMMLSMILGNIQKEFNKQGESENSANQ